MRLARLSADPVRDAEYRAAAIQVAEMLRDRMLHVATSQEMMTAIATHGSVMTRIPIEFPESLGIRPTEFLMVLQGQKGASTEAAYFEASNMIVGLRLLPTDAKEAARTRPGRKMLQRYLINSFSVNRDIIVHEIIHMLDYLRGNISFRTVAPAYSRASGEQYRILYINNPEEFNALFQQGVVQIIDKLSKFPRSAKAKILGNFDEFMAFANKTSTIMMMRRTILPEWERKLDVRLWQTWQYLRDTQ
jgi:hypothetical protein